MAGPIRQPIDLERFQKYIEDNVKEIKTPIDVKQVLYLVLLVSLYTDLVPFSSAMANQIQHIFSRPLMAFALSCERSRQESSSPKQPIESTVNTVYFMLCRTRMLLHQKHISSVKMMI